MNTSLKFEIKNIDKLKSDIKKVSDLLGELEQTLDKINNFKIELVSVEEQK